MTHRERIHKCYNETCLCGNNVLEKKLVIENAYTLSAIADTLEIIAETLCDINKKEREEQMEKQVGFKRCPFCGSNEIVVCTSCDLFRQIEENGEFGYYAVCDAQRGGCGSSTGWHTTKKEAIDAWNRRADHV